MRPLIWVGLGLLVVVFDFSLDGIDVFSDPVGWCLVCLGCAALPIHLDQRLLIGIAVVAAFVSVPLLFSTVTDPIGQDLPLGWALSLPQVMFVLLLARAMGRAAGEAGDESARGWWRLVLWGSVVLLILPPVVYGAGIAEVLLLGALIGLAAVVAAVLLCFQHADRPWVQGPGTPPGRPA